MVEKQCKCIQDHLWSRKHLMCKQDVISRTRYKIDIAVIEH